MSDVRCPSCGDSFRVPDFAVPAGAMAKCPWCGDSFSMSMLIVHLPPVAELIGEDGQPIAIADLAQDLAPLALAPLALAPLALTASDHTAGGPALRADNFDTDELDADNFADQPLVASEVANDVREFAEEGVAFAEAGVPEPSAETTEWDLESARQPDGDEAELLEIDADESDEPADWNAEAEADDEFGVQSGSPPRPLAEVTELGLGGEDRSLIARPRSKRQAAPLKSIIGIVVGGLLAFPLAAGILALYGQPLDLGFWPFDGDTIAMNSGGQRSAAPPMERSPRFANNDNQGGRSLADDMPSLNVDPPSLADAPGDTIDNATASGSLDQPVSDAADDLDDLLAAPLPSSEFADITPPASIELPPLDLPSLAPEPAPEPAALEPEMAAAVSDLGAAIVSPDPFGPPATLPSTDPVPTDEPAVDVPAVDVPAVDEPAVDVPAVDVPAVDVPAVDVPAVAEPVAPAPPIAQPTVSAALQSALETASTAMGDVLNYDESEGVKGKNARLTTLLTQVSAVAAVASSADAAAVGSLVERLIDSDLVSKLAAAAPKWAAYSGRPSDGIMTTGKLVREDDQWLLQWNGPAPLEVRFDDPTLAEDGADVIILGTIQQTAPTTIVDVNYLQKQ